MLKKILKLFVGLILINLVFNHESCLRWNKWTNFKSKYQITFDNSTYEITGLTELEAYIYKYTYLSI
jgi:hypothetical protein